MFAEIPQTLILMTTGAFLLGWILSAINARVRAKYHAKKRDPRDIRIRSLEADQRVAQTDAEELKETVRLLKEELEEANEGVEKRDNVITHQQEKMEDLKNDLKDSVVKTRELRAELSERAEETIKSEVKLREVETELSVARASTDMIATGVLDYALAPENDVDLALESDDVEEHAARDSKVSESAG